MMGRWSRLAGASMGLAMMAWAGAASASSGIDSPESGVEQMGRGSAWVARADSPLAAYFNPAALAFQASGVHVGAHLMFQNRCFTRLGPDGKPVSPTDGVPGPGSATDANGSPGALAPGVCSKPGAFPNPQLAANFRITDQLAIGLAVVAPHASGSNSWPESVTYTGPFSLLSQPASQRYMLINASALIIDPTVAVAFAPLKNLSFGAGFVWGIATVDFTNFSEAQSPKHMDVSDHAFIDSDVKANLKAKDLFIPGFILSAMWLPTDNFDLAAMFKWQDKVNATSSLDLTSLYFASSGLYNSNPCAKVADKKCNITHVDNAGNVSFSIPMEAKLGGRFHLPRKDAERPKWAGSADRVVRDPMSQDVFDIEVDFTWAHNRSVDALHLTFKEGIKVKGTPGTIPVDGDIPRMWKDVVGVHVGGDYVVIPNRLSLRTGAFFETKGQDDKYLSLDFDLAQKVGVSGGATVRVGPVDISVGYQHTFIGTLDNGGKGAVYALSGDQAGCKTSSSPPSPGCYRSQQVINGGKLEESLNELGLAGTIRY